MKKPSPSNQQKNKKNKKQEQRKIKTKNAKKRKKAQKNKLKKLKYVRPRKERFHKMNSVFHRNFVTEGGTILTIEDFPIARWKRHTTLGCHGFSIRRNTEYANEMVMSSRWRTSRVCLQKMQSSIEARPV